MNWMYDKINRVPKISNKQIEEMRHIYPTLRVDGSFVKRVKDQELIDPRNQSFLWDAVPEGDEFTFHQLNSSTIITQHHSAIFFKPSLAEVYAWIRVYMPKTWNMVTCFCMDEPARLGSSSDMMCHCTLMGCPKLVKGKSFTTVTGYTGHELVET